MAFKWNTEEDVKKTDDFNEFMISKWAFTRAEDWTIYVNPSYAYWFGPLLLEYKNR